MKQVLLLSTFHVRKKKMELLHKLPKVTARKRESLDLIQAVHLRFKALILDYGAARYETMFWRHR